MAGRPKKVSLINEVLQQYVEAVNSGNTKLAAKLAKQLDILKLPSPTASTEKAAVRKRPAKAEKVVTSTPKPKTRATTTKKATPKKKVESVVDSPESSYMAPTRPNGYVAPVQNAVAGQNRTAQWRTFTPKPTVPMDDKSVQAPHAKIDKKLAKAKRQSEPRDEVRKVTVTCYQCHRPTEVYAEDLERTSDDDRTTKAKQVRCNDCTSLK